MEQNKEVLYINLKMFTTSVTVDTAINGKILDNKRMVVPFDKLVEKCILLHPNCSEIYFYGSSPEYLTAMIQKVNSEIFKKYERKDIKFGIIKGKE